MLKRTDFSQLNVVATTNTDATTNECYNEQFLSIKSECYIEHRWHNEGILSIKSGFYNQHGSYNEPFYE